MAALPQSRTSFKPKYVEFSGTEEDKGYQGRDAWKTMEKTAYSYQFDEEYMDEGEDGDEISNEIWQEVGLCVFIQQVFLYLYLRLAGL